VRLTRETTVLVVREKARLDKCVAMRTSHPGSNLPGQAGRALQEPRSDGVACVNGFSLLEVMCAILILGISLVGLTQGITAALRSSKESEVQTAAALIAAGQIETLRAEGFVIDGESEGDCDELPLYHWRQSVSSTTIDGLHDVAVTVENSKSGKGIYELRTLIFDPPLDDALLDKSSKRSDPSKPDKRNRSQR